MPQPELKEDGNGNRRGIKHTVSEYSLPNRLKGASKMMSDR